jgi:hypothetical protein
MRTLAPEDLVAISLPTKFADCEDVIQFYVLAMIDSVVALEPVRQQDLRRLPERIRNCIMTFESGRTIVGLKGHLYRRLPGDWRFKLTDTSPDQAAGGLRIRFCAPLTVANGQDQTPGMTLEMETLNLGADGVMVDAGAERPVPEQATLTLSLPGCDEPIRASATLAARQGVLCDFSYQQMEADSRSRLSCFIIEYQRAVLRYHTGRYRSDVSGLDDDLDL